MAENKSKNFPSKLSQQHSKYNTPPVLCNVNERGRDGAIHLNMQGLALFRIQLLQIFSLKFVNLTLAGSHMGLLKQ